MCSKRRRFTFQWNVNLLTIWFILTFFRCGYTDHKMCSDIKTGARRIFIQKLREHQKWLDPPPKIRALCQFLLLQFFLIYSFYQFSNFWHHAKCLPAHKMKQFICVFVVVVVFFLHNTSILCIFFRKNGSNIVIFTHQIW